MGRCRIKTEPNGVENAQLEYRYREQQSFIEDVAARLGVVVFRPEYHRKTRDKNTVLLYTKEDHAHNCKVDGEPFHYSSADEARLYGCHDEKYYYRPYFWCFENTDANGHMSYDFANFGRIDLRSYFDWRRNIEEAIREALNRYLDKKKGEAK